MKLKQPRVAGIKLREFDDVARDTLSAWTEKTNGKVRFETDQAEPLTLTPEKPNSARTEVTIRYMGETAGRLFVIVFAPGDGTGAASDEYNLDNIDTCPLPAEPKIIPRSKKGFAAEAHLTLASHLLDPDGEGGWKKGGEGSMVPGAGCLTELGLNGRSQVTDRYSISNLGNLGQDYKSFNTIMCETGMGYLDATLTVGDHEGVRFGDAHAVINEYPFVAQVCAFVPVMDADAARLLPMLDDLGARPPESIRRTK